MLDDNEGGDILFFNSPTCFQKCHPGVDIGKFKYHTKESLDKKNEASLALAGVIIDALFGKNN